jgi:ABC-type molybdate transport system permease subunit
VTVSTVAISTVIGLLAAYAIVFSDMRLREALLRVNLALMVIPPVALLIPMFVLMVDIGLINSLASVVIFYAGLTVPFSVFFFVNFFRQFPVELIDAATVDGATPFTILRRIVLPISAAATFTLVIVNAIWVWNELLIALVFLQDESRRTVMAGLTLFQGRYVQEGEFAVLVGPSGCGSRRCCALSRDSTSRPRALWRSAADAQPVDKKVAAPKRLRGAAPHGRQLSGRGRAALAAGHYELDPPPCTNAKARPGAPVP